MPLPQQQLPITPGLTLTAQDIVASALRKIKAIAAGVPLKPEEAADGIAAANQMLDEWDAQQLSVFTRTATTLALTPGKQAYTLGPIQTADFYMDRPAEIDRFTIQNLNNPAMPLDLPLRMLTDAEWANIRVKNVSSTIPRQIYDDGGFPLRTLNFYPVPQVAINFTMWAWTKLQKFADLNTKYTFPSGYPKAIIYNLAVDLAPEFSEVDPKTMQVVIGIARSAKATIKAANAQKVYQTFESSLNGGDGAYYNYLTDEPQ